MPGAELALQALARLLDAELLQAQDPSWSLDGVAPLDEAGPRQLSLIRNFRHIRSLKATRAGAVLCANRRLAGHAPCPVLLVGDLSRALASCLEHFHHQVEAPGIMEGARVDDGARLGPDCRVEPGAWIERGAKLGAACHVGANSVIRGCCTLGDGVRVGPGTVLGAPGFGLWRQGGQAHRVPQVGGVVIEDDVELGARCTVDRATLGCTRIGAGSKLDAAVHVGHNVHIGCGVVIAAQSGLSGSVRIEDGAVLGGKVGVADHVVIGAGAQVGAGSGVGSHVPAGARVAGYPAVPVERWLGDLLRQRRGRGRARGREQESKK